MAPRRSPTNLNPDHGTPLPTSGPFGGMRSLSLVTDQTTSLATTAQMVGAGPYQSESTSQAPPMPLPPSPSPEMSPHHNANLQSIPPETLDFPSPSQSPNSMPMPTPTPQSPFHSLPTPILPHGQQPAFGGGFVSPSDHPASSEGEGPPPHQPAPGEGVGGFTYPRQYYPHPPDYGSSDISRGIHAKVWHTYNKVSQGFDEKKLEKWNKDLDTLLIFAALFSAIITAFLVTALNDLGPNYQQQSALLLYQSLNGRDPNLASMSDPTAPFHPSGSAIAVNFLWSASLSASLGASFIAVICKEWLAEYNSCTSVAVDLLQACWRQHRFLILRKLKIHFIISLLPPLLHSSVLFFFAGAVIYFWQINVRVAIVYLVAGGTFCIAYLISTFLPIVMKAPFRPSSAELVHRSSVAIGKVTKPIVGAFTRRCSLALRSVIGVVPWQIARTVFAVNAALGIFYQQTRKIFSRGSKHTRDWWADVSNDSLDEIDTSQRAQEEAILWLSQMPLDPSESEDVVSSLALISRPHKFPKSMVVFVCFALDSWIHEAPDREQADPDRRQADPAINCVILLGHIKYQSVVDRNSDQDHNIGGIPVTTSVAWAAQQLATGGFDKSFNTPYPEEIRARLLTAAAWLSPEDATEEVTPEGKKLEIRDRSEFLKEIAEILTKRVRSGGPFDSRVLINLIHGMHACIPRGNYGSASSIIPFLQLFCEGYGSPWSGDESALSALITYALDLLLPSGRGRPLVEREIEFGELASELIEVLKADVTAIDVVMFGFWLIYCVPYAFRSRKSVFADIVHIRASTIPEDNGEVSDDRRRILEDYRKRVDFLAVGAFAAAAQCHVAANDTLPKLAVHNTLDLLRAAPEDGYGRLMGTYGVAMILNLSSSSQAATFAGEVDAQLYTNALYVVRDDVEWNTAEENVLNLHIYSALVLLKLPQLQADIKAVKTLIREMKNTINGPVVRVSGLAGGSETEASADLDRVRWKVVYLFGLLFKLLPPGEWERDIEVLRDSVRTLVLSREFPLADDYERCIGPLGMDAPHLGYLDERQWLGRSAFEGWIHKFPLFPLAGSKIRDSVISN